MAQQFIQQLTVHLKGGQTVVVPFNAEKAEVLSEVSGAEVVSLVRKEKEEKPQAAE